MTNFCVANDGTKNYELWGLLSLYHILEATIAKLGYKTGRIAVANMYIFYKTTLTMAHR